MKVRNLFVLSMAALAFAACSKDDAIIDEPVVPQEGSLVVNLTSLAPVVKANTETGIGAEGTLKNVWVYAFKADGSMEGAAQKAEVTTVNNVSTATLTWQLPVGSYTIAAVSGIENAFAGATVTSLPGEVIALTANTRSNFVMYKSQSVTIAAPTEAAPAATVSMELARVLAGVKLVNIKTQFDSKIPAEYKSSIKTLEYIKIVGSKESALLSGGVNAVAKVTTEDNMTKALFENADAVTITDNDLSAVSFTTAARAYACPGTVTRITIGVTYSDTSIGTRYYSVTSNELVANTMYGLKITITGVGSKDPNDPTPVGTADFSLIAQDWTTGTAIEGNPEY